MAVGVSVMKKIPPWISTVLGVGLLASAQHASAQLPPGSLDVRSEGAEHGEAGPPQASVPVHPCNGHTSGPLESPCATLGAPPHRATFPASDLQFDGIFAQRADDTLTVYCLLGSGFLRAPSSGAEDSLIPSWLLDHPHARVTPVTVMCTPGWGQIVFAWVDDGDENLNVALVRTGTCPAGVMLDAVDATASARESPEWKAIERGYMEEGGPASTAKTSLCRLVTVAQYEAFILRVASAELKARDEELGIWSPEFPAR